MKQKDLLLTSHEISLEQLNERLKSILIDAHNRGLEPMVFSDFDNTLCDNYVFDPLTNNHLPQINPEISRLAKGASLFIATARFADDPAVTTVAQQLHPGGWFNKPMINENGGIIFFPSTGKKEILAPIGFLDELTGLKEKFDTQPPLSIPGQSLFTKLGETVLWLRMQDQDGNGQPEFHQRLAWAIKDKIDRKKFQVTSGGSSVIIQSPETSKKLAFLTLLNQLSIDRLKTFVIGLGDAPNDEPIFQASDFAIGVKSQTFGYVNEVCPFGEQTALEVLKVINQNG